MTCTDTEIEIIDEISDGIELSKRASKHLSHCNACQAYQKEMTEIFYQEEAPFREPDEQYWSGIWNTLEPQLKQEAFVIRLVKKPVVKQLLAALLLVGFAFWAGQLTQEDSGLKQGYDKQVLSFFHKSRIAVSSFANMDEYEQHEMLRLVVQTSDSLLKQTGRLQAEYEDNQELQLLFTDIEKLLLLISSMKGKSPSVIQKFQYRFQEGDLLENLNSI